MNSIKQKIFNGIKWTGLSSVLKSLFQILQYAILARFLTPNAFGLIALAMFVINLSNIFIDMGLTSAILHKQKITIHQFSSIYWLNILISIIIFILIYILTPSISIFYNEPKLIHIIPILSVNLLIIAFGVQHRTMMQKELRFKEISNIEITSSFVSLFVSIILILNDFGVYALIYSTLLSSMLQYSFFFFLNIKKNPIIFFFRYSDIKDMLKVGVYQFGSSLLSFFTKEIDILIIGKILGTESLGIYSLSKQLIVKFSKIINPTITRVITPILSALQKEEDRLKVGYLKMIYYLTSVNIPVYLLFIVLSKEILEILYGIEYTSSYKVLIFLSIAYCAKSISNPIGSLLIAKGRTDLGFKWSIFQVSITTLFIGLASTISIDAVAITIAILTYLLLIPQWKYAVKECIVVSLKEYLFQFYRSHLVFIIISSISVLTSILLEEVKVDLLTLIIIKSMILLVLFVILILILDKRRIFIFKELKEKFI